MSAPPTEPGFYWGRDDNGPWLFFEMDERGTARCATAGHSYALYLDASVVEWGPRLLPPPHDFDTVTRGEDALRLRLQRAGLCPWHEDPEFGCEPCADRQLRGDEMKDGKWIEPPVPGLTIAETVSILKTLGVDDHPASAYERIMGKLAQLMDVDVHGD